MDKETKSRSKGLNLPVVLLLIAGAFVVGMFYNRMQSLEMQIAELSSSSGVNGSNSGNVAQPAAGGGADTQVAAGNRPNTRSAGEVDPVTEDDHVRGDRNAKVMLIEYSDLECPFCKRFHPTAKQVVDTYDGQVAWVYRHFPLTQIHSKAPKEAEATECVAELGGGEKFWEYVDLIFEVSPTNNGLDLGQLPVLASQIGINESEFQSCLDSGKYAAEVQKDFESGRKAGVTGTPGNVLLNTETGETVLMPGAYPFEQVKQAIDQMLQG